MKKRASVNENKCRACGCCVRSCPLERIKLGKKMAEIAEDCAGCGNCAKACPFDAIELVNRYCGGNIYAEQKR